MTVQNLYNRRRTSTEASRLGATIRMAHRTRAATIPTTPMTNTGGVPVAVVAQPSSTGKRTRNAIANRLRRLLIKRWSSIGGSPRGGQGSVQFLGGSITFFSSSIVIVRLIPCSPKIRTTECFCSLVPFSNCASNASLRRCNTES